MKLKIVTLALLFVTVLQIDGFASRICGVQVQEQELQTDPQTQDQKDDAPPQDNEDGEAVELLADPNADTFLQFQRTAVKSKLERLQSRFELEESSIEKIVEELKDEIKAAAKRVQELGSAGGLMMDSELEGELESELWEAVRPHLVENEKAQFEEFVRMQSVQKEARLRNCVTGLVVFLDNLLCFTPKQFEDVEKLYLEHWDSRYNEQVGTMVLNGLIFGRDILDLVKAEKLEPILSELQMDAFISLGEDQGMRGGFQMAINPGPNSSWDTEIFRKHCEEMMQLKLDELNQVVALDEKQTKILGIAKKGAIGKVVERWEELVSKSQNVGAFDRALMVEMTEPIVTQCERQNSWSKTLERILSEEQYQKYSQRQELRENTSKRQMVSYLTYIMCSQQFGIELDLEQHAKIAETVLEKASMAHANDYMGIAFSLMDLPDEDFQEILTEKQWEHAQPKLLQGREQMQQFREQMDENEASEEDADEDSDEDDQA